MFKRRSPSSPSISEQKKSTWIHRHWSTSSRWAWLPPTKQLELENSEPELVTPEKQCSTNTVEGEGSDEWADTAAPVAAAGCREGWKKALCSQGRRRGSCAKQHQGGWQWKRTDCVPNPGEAKALRLWEWEAAAQTGYRLFIPLSGWLEFTRGIKLLRLFLQ